MIRQRLDEQDVPLALDKPKPHAFKSKHPAIAWSPRLSVRDVAVSADLAV